MKRYGNYYGCQCYRDMKSYEDNDSNCNKPKNGLNYGGAL